MEVRRRAVIYVWLCACVRAQVYIHTETLDYHRPGLTRKAVNPRRVRGRTWAAVAAVRAKHNPVEPTLARSLARTPARILSLPDDMMLRLEIKFDRRPAAMDT